MPGIVGITRYGSGLLASPVYPAWPLKPDPTSRFLVDQMGVPFRIHGEASWDAHINLSQTDWRAYLDDRKAKGFTALFTYLLASVVYYSGGTAPALQTGELPFLKNTSGTTWTGVFANHDADFSTPNDAYFAKVAGFIDDCAARGIVVIINPMYAGFGLGSSDGWWQTITNATNTQAVCQAFGAYLANGSTTFTGFKSRGNIIWIAGGDTLPTNGSEGAKRMVKVFNGLQANGANQPVTTHWQRNYLPNDQTDFSGLLTTYGLYTQPVTYAMARNIYGSQSPSRPSFLVEDWYWGEHSVTRAQLRYEQWAASLTCQSGGGIMSITPLWTFATSTDGSGSPTTAWIATTAYTLNSYVSKASKWYRCTVAGTSGSTGPSGTGTSISDGTVTWTYVAAVSGTMGGMANLLSEPATLDHQQMGLVLGSTPWWKLVPESLGVMGSIVTSGQGTAATWSDQGTPSGGTDWIVAAASADGSVLIAYVPDPHSGAFSIDMTKLAGPSTASWIDPVSGTATTIAQGIANTGTHSFTVPGANSGGDNDWLLRVST